MMLSLFLGFLLGYCYHLIFTSSIKTMYRRDLSNKKVIPMVLNFFMRYGILLLFLGVPLIILKVNAILFAVTFFCAFCLLTLKAAGFFK